MKFLIEFSSNNLIKFRSFIRMCSRIFSKSGIVMTITKNEQIRVVPDPFNISDQFQHDYCSTKSLEIYKNSIFVEYPLISSLNSSKKNSTYDKLELKTTKKEQNSKFDAQYENRVLSFRITREELTKLNELLSTNFESSEQLSLKVTSIPDFVKNKIEHQNYTKAYLTIYDKPTNSTKSGILLKPLKKPYEISDYEDDMDNEENKLLGKFLYGNIIKTKIIKKFGLLASKNLNKIINFYIYKEKDLKENNVKSYLFLAYLSNNIYLGRYIQNDENNEDQEEFKNIYKIQINSDLLIKILKNFNNDINNPDYISVWTKGLVFKTDFTLTNNFEDVENNNNNFFNNEGENSESNGNENMEDNRSYMLIKSFSILEKDAVIIENEIDEEGEGGGSQKKKFILNLIDNNMDDKHEELNKSLDLTDIDGGVVYRGNNSFMDENENEDDIQDDDEDDKKVKINKKKNQNKNKPKKRTKSIKKKKNDDEDDVDDDDINTKNNNNNDSDDYNDNESENEIKESKKNNKKKKKTKEPKSKNTKKNKKNK